MVGRSRAVRIASSGGISRLLSERKEDPNHPVTPEPLSCPARQPGIREPWTPESSTLLTHELLDSGAEHRDE
jgi:hypothetical protein